MKKFTEEEYKDFMDRISIGINVRYDGENEIHIIEDIIKCLGKEYGIGRGSLACKYCKGALKLNDHLYPSCCFNDNHPFISIIEDFFKINEFEL